MFVTYEKEEERDQKRGRPQYVINWKQSQNPGKESKEGDDNCFG